MELHWHKINIRKVNEAVDCIYLINKKLEDKKWDKQRFFMPVPM